jgi:hypothetical protein
MMIRKFKELEEDLKENMQKTIQQISREHG